MYFLKNQQRKKMEWVNHKYSKWRQKKMKGKENTGGKNRKQEDRLPLNHVTCKWSNDLKGYQIMWKQILGWETQYFNSQIITNLIYSFNIIPILTPAGFFGNRIKEKYLHFIRC